MLYKPSAHPSVTRGSFHRVTSWSLRHNLTSCRDSGRVWEGVDNHTDIDNNFITAFAERVLHVDFGDYRTPRSSLPRRKGWKTFNASLSLTSATTIPLVRHFRGEMGGRSSYVTQRQPR
jgi:hypothetical protein